VAWPQDSWCPAGLALWWLSLMAALAALLMGQL
jgi:hypothetical protein